MQTLFRSISNGLDWSEAVDTLLPVGGIWIGLFYLYIAFISALTVTRRVVLEKSDSDV